MQKHSTMRNSIDGGAGRDNNSVERLESLGLDNENLQRPSKQVNITNQINKTYIVQGGSNNKQRGGAGQDDGEGETGPSAMDLQAQILLELQQANNLAKKTKTNVKKIAKTAKPIHD